MAGEGIVYLDRHTIDCGSGRALQKWHLAGYGCGGDDRQIYYRCAELGHWPAEAGYACEDDYVYGGNQLQTITSVTTLEDCQAACTARMDCAALIHNNLNSAPTRKPDPRTKLCCNHACAGPMSTCRGRLLPRERAGDCDRRRPRVRDRLVPQDAGLTSCERARCSARSAA